MDSEWRVSLEEGEEEETQRQVCEFCTHLQLIIKGGERVSLLLVLISTLVVGAKQLNNAYLKKSSLLLVISPTKKRSTSSSEDCVYKEI